MKKKHIRIYYLDGIFALKVKHPKWLNWYPNSRDIKKYSIKVLIK